MENIIIDLKYAIQLWVMPPGINILIAFIGLILLKNKPKVGKFLVVFSLISLWLLSTPIIAKPLISYLENQYPIIIPTTLKSVDKKNVAIVVLSAGNNLATKEFANPTTTDPTLIRLHYAAYLHQLTKIPILVSGSNRENPSFNKAKEMADTLRQSFGSYAKWQEPIAINTAEEGFFVTEILKKSGVKKIYLVTHAYHMPRSVFSFRHRGLEVIPAPTGFVPMTTTLTHLSSYLPSIDALDTSETAIHEYLGMLWYWLYYRMS